MTEDFAPWTTALAWVGQSDTGRLFYLKTFAGSLEAARRCAALAIYSIPPLDVEVEDDL